MHKAAKSEFYKSIYINLFAIYQYKCVMFTKYISYLKDAKNNKLQKIGFRYMQKINLSKFSIGYTYDNDIF